MKSDRDYQKRLNEMIVKDIKESAFGLDKLIKSEMIGVLKNYFILSGDEVDIEINATSNGRYELTMHANVRGVKGVKKIV